MILVWTDAADSCSPSPDVPLVVQIDRYENRAKEELHSLQNGFVPDLLPLQESVFGLRFDLRADSR